MRIFLSYAREDKPLADRVSSALNAAGFETFLDTKNLPPGEEFNARIKTAIDRADLFVFLASSSSIRPGSYSLTELSFAEAKWKKASGYVLPVLSGGFDAGELPAYLKPITALSAKGNLEAEVVAWIKERVAGGSGGAGVSTPSDQLREWARSATPPLGRGRKGFPISSLGPLVGGAAFIGLGVLSASFFSEWNRNRRGLGPQGPAGFEQVFQTVPIVIGAALILFGVFKVLRGLGGATKPVAAVVLDRSSTKQGTSLHVELIGGQRVELEPVSARARKAYPGDIGWAYVSGSLLIDFVPRKAESLFS